MRAQHSLEEINRVLDCMDLTGKYPVACGKISDYLFRQLTQLNMELGNSAPTFTWPHGETNKKELPIGAALFFTSIASPGWRKQDS